MANGLGWSREAVKNYAALQRIDADAWEVVGTAFQQIVPDEENDSVPSNGTTVPNPFTEGLLRNILDLSPDQQLDLVRSLEHRSPATARANNHTAESTNRPQPMARKMLGRSAVYRLTRQQGFSVAPPLAPAGQRTAPRRRPPWSTAWWTSSTAASAPWWRAIGATSATGPEPSAQSVLVPASRHR